MSNEELDSQLSAMFDDELPEPECELLARRLARDEALKARWGRYAVIGACIRMGRDVRPVATSSSEARMPSIRLHGDLASRVSRLVAAEPALLAGAGARRGTHGSAYPAVSRWWQPVAGGAVVAAGVAAAAILWLRASSPDAPIVAQAESRSAAPIVLRTQALPVALSSGAAAVPAAARIGVTAPAEHDSFVVPPPSRSPSFAPPVELANFVVAHSEYSMPLLRRNVLSALVAEESDVGDADGDAPAAAPAASSTASGATSGSPHAPHADYAR